MSIFNNTGLLINALATAASLAGFLLSIHLLVRDREKQSRILAWRYFTLFVFCSVLLLSSGYFYTKRITTLPQSGYFTVNVGITNEIFYPIPYMTNPSLSFQIIRRRATSADGIVHLLEQRPDGFKAETDGKLPQLWAWEADGRPIELTNNAGGH